MDSSAIRSATDFVIRSLGLMADFWRKTILASALHQLRLLNLILNLKKRRNSNTANQPIRLWISVTNRNLQARR